MITTTDPMAQILELEKDEHQNLKDLDPVHEIVPVIAKEDHTLSLQKVHQDLQGLQKGQEVPM